MPAAASQTIDAEQRTTRGTEIGKLLIVFKMTKPQDFQELRWRLQSHSSGVTTAAQASSRRRLLASWAEYGGKSEVKRRCAGMSPSVVLIQEPPVRLVFVLVEVLQLLFQWPRCAQVLC